MRKLLPALLLLLVAGSALARAQDFTLAKNGVAVVSLSGQWRFHPGDNPAWAAPSFDDTAWPLLKSTESWSHQGYDIRGYGWYRFSVALPAGNDQWALFLPWIDSAYEVYADGAHIFTNGLMPPHGDISPITTPRSCRCQIMQGPRPNASRSPSASGSPRGKPPAAPPRAEAASPQSTAQTLLPRSLCFLSANSSCGTRTTGGLK